MARLSSGVLFREEQYRELLEKVKELDASGSCDNAIYRKTLKIINKADALINEGTIEEKVENPGEAILDSRIMLGASNIVSHCANNMTGTANDYNADEFAHLVKTSGFWKTATLPCEIPLYNYLFGTFVADEVPARVAKQRKQFEKPKMKEQQEPENVTLLEKDEESSELVNLTKKILVKCYKDNGKKPICFLKFVLDPNSYSRTVENIYHISFLIKDGYAKFVLDENEVTFILPVLEEDAQKKKTTSENKQFIMSIDMDMWKEAVEALQIREPMIKLKNNKRKHSS